MFAQRVAGISAALILGLALTACGSGEPTVMPDVIGSTLEKAKSDIERAGFSSDVEVLGGGMFGILDDSAWMVCEQLPDAGDAISGEPRLTVDRSCGGGAEQQTEETPAPEPESDVVVTDTTVDELLNRLNAPEMGGIQLGDQFRFTGELFMSELWMTGATGEYTVYFKAHGGAQDLFVLIDEFETLEWTDGTVVEMVVESVEVEIDGETTDGWLRAVSASTL
ncbi:hypothetical protein AUC47_11855 [Microbacterium sp. SZ1]|nr:hypothetical protein AUC47_11855 [Microbacterium sp. SZ1]